MELIRLLLRNTTPQAAKLAHDRRYSRCRDGVCTVTHCRYCLACGVEASTANRLVTRHAVSFVFPPPMSYRDRIAQVRGVDKVTYATWFSASTSTKSNSLLAWQWIQRAFSMSIPSSLSSGSNLKALNESVTPPSIGIGIANRYNLKLGDVMSIDGDVYPGRWEFVVRGIYQPRDQTTNPASMMFHHKYIDERVRQ